MALLRVYARWTVIFSVCFNLCYGSRTVEVRGEQKVLAGENERVLLSCEENSPMTYCGFSHPNGTRYSYTGSDLSSGKCSIEVTVTKNETGDWQCHIGKKTAGLEIIKTIHLVVGDKLVAPEPYIKATHGREVILSCYTTENMIPLTYCRFQPPKGLPFSIDHRINRNNSIEGRYYFPSNMSLDRGECAVSIKRTKYEDQGKWLCGAWIENKDSTDTESTDYINLEIEGLYTMTSVSATGISVGIVIVLFIIASAAYYSWKKSHEKVEEGVEATENIELGQHSAELSRGDHSEAGPSEVETVTVELSSPTSK